MAPALPRLVWLAPCAAWLAWTALGAEVIPPKPNRYFNDYAGVVSQEAAGRLDRMLEEFERKTSSQIVVVVFPKMQSDSSIEDYTVRVAQTWGVGQKDKNNGAILFVFIQDRQMFLQVGYGLEGAIPDATAKTIIEQEIKPRFRENDYEGGLTAGVQAMLQAARGEYQGTGQTVAEGRRRPGGGLPFFMIVLVLFILIASARRSHGTIYRGSGRRPWGGWGGGWHGGGWGGGGWSGGGGGGGWSGGGSFSGGGGSFGGGGAGGRW
jgi:uncharacterized protein